MGEGVMVVGMLMPMHRVLGLLSGCCANFDIHNTLKGVNEHCHHSAHYVCVMQWGAGGHLFKL